MELPEEIYELILAEFQGEIEQKGRDKLRVWLEKDVRNRETHKELYSLWYSGKWAMAGTKIKKYKAWEQVVRKRRAKIGMRWAMWGTSIAASVALMVSLFLIFRADNEKSPVFQMTEGKPGDVTLVLSNGERMNVKNLPRGVIEERGGIICPDSAYLEYRNTKMKQMDEKIVYNELIVPKGEEYRLRLADGSLVIVNSESRLRYPVRFNGVMREVFLSGEACFEVTKDSLKPFIVRTDRVGVRVLGTLFNVSAYADENHTQVTLVNGLVEVSVDNKNNILKPNEQWMFDRHSGKQVVREVDAENYIAWTSGLFRFDAMPLEQLMLKLSRWFDIHYEFSDASLKEVRYSGGFRKNDSVEDILHMIGKITNVSFIVKDGVIKINKNG